MKVNELETGDPVLVEIKPGKKIKGTIIQIKNTFAEANYKYVVRHKDNELNPKLDIYKRKHLTPLKFKYKETTFKTLDQGQKFRLKEQLEPIFIKTSNNIAVVINNSSTAYVEGLEVDLYDEVSVIPISVKVTEKDDIKNYLEKGDRFISKKQPYEVEILGVDYSMLQVAHYFGVIREQNAYGVFTPKDIAQILTR